MYCKENFHSIAHRVSLSPSWPVTQRGTFDIFLHECTHFLSVRIPITCGQVILTLAKKHALVHDGTLFR